MINVGIDGRALIGNMSGIGKYIYELCKSLNRYDSFHFYIYSNRPFKFQPFGPNWHFRIEKKPFFQKMKVTLWLKLRCGHLCKSDNLSIFWGSAHFFPSLDRRVKKLLTVYDFVYLIFPQSMSFWHYWAHKLFFKSDLKKADKVVTISQGTKDRLKDFFEVDAEAVVRPCVGRMLEKENQSIDISKIDSLLGTHYFLAIATLEPRKNLETVIKTFLAAVDRDVLPEHKLVLVGNLGWKCSELVELINNSNRIVYLGYLEESLLPLLYANCSASIYLSIYEGFGMPVLESRAYGTKVLVVSDTPETREAGGEFVNYIKPDFDALMGFFIKLKEGKNFIINHESANVIYENYNWDHEADKMQNLFESLLNEGVRGK